MRCLRTPIGGKRKLIRKSVSVNTYETRESEFNIFLQFGFYFSDEHAETDTICELPVFQKIRLCNVIMSAKKYSKNLTFVPSEQNVDPQCVRKDIELEGAKDQDWMIGCKAAKLKNNETLTYYVSRGFSGYNYYICSSYEPGDTHRCVAGVTHRIAAKPFLQEKHFFANRTQNDGH